MYATLDQYHTFNTLLHRLLDVYGQKKTSVRFSPKWSIQEAEAAIEELTLQLQEYEERQKHMTQTAPRRGRPSARQSTQQTYQQQAMMAVPQKASPAIIEAIQGLEDALGFADAQCMTDVQLDTLTADQGFAKLEELKKLYQQKVQAQAPTPQPLPRSKGHTAASLLAAAHEKHQGLIKSSEFGQYMDNALIFANHDVFHITGIKKVIDGKFGAKFELDVHFAAPSTSYQEKVQAGSVTVKQRGTQPTEYGIITLSHTDYREAVFGEIVSHMNWTFAPEVEEPGTEFGPCALAMSGRAYVLIAA